MAEVDLQFIEGKSKKFWRAKVEGSNVVVRYGRIGTDGQTNVKTCSSAAEAEQVLNKLADSKRKKGYADTGAAPAGTDEEPEPEAPPAPGPRSIRLEKKSEQLSVELSMEGNQLVTTVREECKNEDAARALLDRIERAMRDDGYQVSS